MPKVSIILSCHNSEQNIEETIGSVLKQDFFDFEFIIVNDGSADLTQKILDSFQKKDKRIILIKNETNIGLTSSLNNGLAIAEGNYIARIDAGDLWDKTKLGKQVKFLNENPDYIICGTQAFYIDEQKKVLGVSSFKNEDRDIKINFFTREGIFFHPSIVFRNIGIRYRDFFRYSQDFDLYARLYFKGKFYCFQEPLTYSKLSENDMTIKKRYYQRKYYNIAHKFFIERRKYGRDDLDIGKKPDIKNTKLGLRFCELSMFFILKYIKSRVSKNRKFIWPFYLFIGCIIYPPFLSDYLIKIKNIIIYKKLKFKISL